MTVHSNTAINFASPQTTFSGFQLADVDGNGRAEWVVYTNAALVGTVTGFTLVVANADDTVSQLVNYTESGIIYNSPRIEHMLTGRFFDFDVDSILLFSTYHDGSPRPDEVRGFNVDLAHKTLIPKLTQPTYTGFSVFPRDEEFGESPGTGGTSRKVQILAGDFDGDDLDELMFFNPNNGQVRIRKYKLNDVFYPMESFDPGNLKDSTSFLKNSILLAGLFTEPNIDGDLRQRDCLLAYNTGDRAIHRFDARRDPVTGGTTFWWAFSTPPGYVPANSQISVADVDGNGLEECIMYDTDSGSVRFFRMQQRLDGTKGLRRVPCLEQGQIPYGPNFVLTEGLRSWGQLVWARMKDFPTEEGNTNNRDDVMVYNVAREAFTRIDARWDGGDETQTFWWGFNIPRSVLVSKLSSP